MGAPSDSDDSERASGTATTQAASDETPGNVVTVAPGADGGTLSSDSLQSSLAGGVIPPRLTPARLGDAARYEIGAELARGGLGRVLIARDRRLGGRAVAIKQLLRINAGPSRRFQREALLTAQLQHPGIVPLYDIGVGDDGEPFYAMKLVSGRTLDDVIAGAGDLRGRLALLPNVLAVAEAIAYAHHEGVIHRDLKPSNVLIGAYGETVVVDWGLAKRIGESQDDSIEPDERAAVVNADLTSVGDVLGTPAYMAPEQAAGHRVDERADVYALGAMLYHVLAGDRPYHGVTGEQVLTKVLQGPPVPLRQRVPDVPPDLAAIVDRAMAREPASRYRTASEVAVDLKRFQTGQLVSAHRYSAWLLVRRWVVRHRAVVAVAAVLLAALIVSSAIFVGRIVHERNVASAERTVAAEERDRATRRSEELMLAQARTALVRDPTASVAWLAELGAATAGHAAEVRSIAADARSRGVAEHVLAAHEHNALIVVFSPDGATLMTTSYDGDAHLWRVTAGVPVRIATLRHGTPVLLAAFSPDGRDIVTGARDGGVRRWSAAARGVLGLESARDVARHREPLVALRVGTDGAVLSGGRDGDALLARPGQSAVTLAHHDGIVTAVAMGPGGAMASAGGNGTVTLTIDGQDRALAHPARVQDMAFAVDGSLVTAAADRQVRHWTQDGKARVLGTLRGTPVVMAPSPVRPEIAVTDTVGDVVVYDLAHGTAQSVATHGAPGNALAYSADGRWLASGGSDSAVRLWNAGGGGAWTLRGHRALVNAVAFSSVGALASADGDGSVRLWRMPDERIDRAVAHSGTVRRLAIAEATGAVTSAGYDGGVWLFAPGQPARLLGRHDVLVDGLAIRRDGTSVFAGDISGRIAEYTAASAPREWPRHPTYWIAISDDGRWLATAGREGAVGLWDMETRASRMLTGHAGGVIQVAFSGDGRALVSAGSDGTVRLWDPATGAGRVIATIKGQAFRVAITPDGQRVAIAGDEGSIVVWDASSSTSRVVYKHQRFATAVAFSSDGRWLVSSSWDQTGRLTPLTGGDGVSLIGHEGQVNAAAFSPDGQHVVTAADDGAVRVWNLRGETVRILRAHEGFVSRLVVSADGRTVASAGADGAVVRWAEPFRPNDAPSVPTAAWISTLSSARVSDDGSVRSPDE